MGFGVFLWGEVMPDSSQAFCVLVLRGALCLDFGMCSEFGMRSISTNLEVTSVFGGGFRLEHALGRRSVWLLLGLVGALDTYSAWAWELRSHYFCFFWLKVSFFLWRSPKVGPH